MDVVLEIGLAKGGVFYTLCQLASDNAMMISLDLPGGPYGLLVITEDAQCKTFLKANQTLHRINKDSHKDSTKDELLKILQGKKIDLLFIDGDHTYEGVKKDWEMYSPLVRKGGIIAFHDINFHPRDITVQVNKLWKEVKPNFKTVEFVDPVDPTWGGIGALEYK